MCWYSYKKPVRKIADKDITCWKVVHLIDSGFKSIYFGKFYEIHKRYFIYDGLDIHKMYYTRCYNIREGFHSYNNKVFIKEDGYE